MMSCFGTSCKNEMEPRNMEFQTTQQPAQQDMHTTDTTITVRYFGLLAEHSRRW